MSMTGDGLRLSWIPGHARRHERTGELDTRWMPASQCGWTFYASVRTLRIADRTHGFHLDESTSATPRRMLSTAMAPCSPPPPPF